MNISDHKHAYSPLHNMFVDVKKVRRDSHGEYLIDATMEGREMVFRSCELEGFDREVPRILNGQILVST